jgi:transposase InsO family protein
MNPMPAVPAPLSSGALLRYSVLAQVEALILGGWGAQAAVREVAGREHAHPDGRVVRLSVRTIQRWRAAYGTGGLGGLEPARRTRTDTSVVLGEGFIAFLQAENDRDPRAGVPELIRRARVRGVVPPDLPLDRTTVWRACRRMGLVTRARPSKREGDMRRWRYPHRMQCVLCDGKHFRAGAQRLRRVALFFLDDATRYGLGVRVGPSESTELFLAGLYDLVLKHGLADLFYLDHGPGFLSADTLAVLEGGLGAWLIHGTVHYPQGRGAIERFNRTAHDQVLRSLDGAAPVDPDSRALTLRLAHFLDRYNDTPHETLGGDTPRQRWEAGRPLRLPADEAELYRRFVVHERRKVSADHVLKIGGKLWEAPRGLGRSWAQLTRHVLDGRLWVLWEGRRIELAELDPHANATDRRGTPPHPLPSEGVPTTAATLAFGHDLRPLVGPDGGFRDPDEPQQEPQENHP